VLQQWPRLTLELQHSLASPTSYDVDLCWVPARSTESSRSNSMQYPISNIWVESNNVLFASFATQLWLSNVNWSVCCKCIYAVTTQPKRTCCV